MLRRLRRFIITDSLLSTLYSLLLFLICSKSINNLARGSVPGIDGHYALKSCRDDTPMFNKIEHGFQDPGKLGKTLMLTIRMFIGD